MDFFGTILWPIKWVIEAILVGFHWLFSEVLGLAPEAGITWVLSIVGLVLIVRAALIPIFVRQIKSQRKMLEVAPELKKIQDKYRGKKDQFSREAMQRETMALYQRAGTNPLSSCLPLLIQMPIFFSLFSVLNEARQDKAGVGLLTQQLADQYTNATLFGVAPLKYSLVDAFNYGNVAVAAIAIAMILIMTASQFYTQLQIMSKNQTPEMKESPMYRQQRILLYILPVVFLFSGLAFPIGVMFYWLTSNVWTLVQQWLVIRNMPTPGSEAALAREARLAKRNRGKMADDAAAIAEVVAEEAAKPVTTQRQQPVGKNRAKKQGGPKK
ncbi:MAG: membrane protein insertase YidC [Leifsonia xyli]|nr:MAG: membrane protein insertase YidC [Leifsonia xyli]